MDSTFHDDIYDEQRLVCMVRIKFYPIIHSEYNYVIRFLYKGVFNKDDFRI